MRQIQKHEYNDIDIDIDIDNDNDIVNDVDIDIDIVNEKDIVNDIDDDNYIYSNNNEEKIEEKVDNLIKTIALGGKIGDSNLIKQYVQNLSSSGNDDPIIYTDESCSSPDSDGMNYTDLSEGDQSHNEQAEDVDQLRWKMMMTMMMKKKIGKQLRSDGTTLSNILNHSQQHGGKSGNLFRN